MSVAEAAGHEFRMGRVANHTFGVIGRNFGTIGLLALVVVAPLFILDLVASRTVSAPTGEPLNPIQFGLTTPISLLLYGVLSVITQAAIIYATVRDLNKQPVRFGEAFSTGAKNFFPILLIWIVAGLGLMLGFVLLVVPGIILSLMWTVIVPVRVVENTGILETLGRSQELTSGYRWQILGLVIVFILLSIAISMVLAPFSIQYSQAILNGTLSTGLLILFSLASALLTMVQIIVSSSGVAAIYYELRVAKEGIGPEALAAVFD